MTQVKSPYNFVPLNKKVFTPEWGKFVSQDIPFKDGLSGKIKLKIKAHTPIFVRGEGEEKKRNINNKTIKYTEYHFFKHNGKYCIPGTSIKGEIANVMEIMSFGRLHKINDHKYGVRDMSDKDDRLVGKAKKCGFLFRDGTGYKIEKCNDLVRINYGQIGRATSQNIRGISVVEKYNRVGKNRMIPVTTNNDVMVVRGREFPIVVAEYDPTSTLEGQLVVTNDFQRKENEFVFIPTGRKVQISNDIIDNFINAYFETDSDYKTLWETEFRNGNPIPVFYTTDRNGNIQAIGFTQMFKLSYKNSIYDLIENNYPELLESKIDLVDSIFGYTDEDNNHKKLKGRVSIEPAMITDNSINEMNPVHTILGEPQPSFYPYYLFQNPDTNKNNRVNGRYKTYMDDDAIISGRKRYPIKEVTIDYQPEDIDDTKNVWVDFVPLPKESEFETIIHYYNIRPVELGALLSAITFHNNNETYHHSIGMAKPLGYGNVTFSIDYSTSTIEEDESLNYMCQYEKMMEYFCQTECDNSHWLQTEQLIELFAMAEPISQNHPKFEDLTYLKLPDHQNIKSTKRETSRECRERLNRRCNDNERLIINDFPKALPRYTDFVNRNISLKSLNCSSDFRPDEDKKQYYITNPNMHPYIKSKKENFIQFIEQHLQDLKSIVQKKEAEKDKKRLRAIENAEEAKRKRFREEEGIDMLKDVKNMKSLRNKTNQWRLRYYNEQERITIKEAIIPEKYLPEFMKILNDLFEKNKKKFEWKNKKEISKNLKYLILCIGKEKAEKWYKEKQSNKNR